MKRYVAFGTGKTGGHLFPAIEMARELKGKGIDSIFFIEGNQMEISVLKKYGFKYKKIFAAPLTSGNALVYWNLFFKNILGFIQTFTYFIFNRPYFSVITGGYNAFPLAFSSLILFIPLFTYEGNVLIGKVNRLFAPFAYLNFSPQKGKRGKYIETGFIVREEIKNVPFIFNKNHFTILVSGGSQGSKLILENVFNMIKKYENYFKNNNIKFHISCGHKNTEYIKKFEKFPFIKAEIFIMDMKKALIEANLIICRAGAMTIEENLATGRIGIYIPLKIAAENHQYYNAKRMEEKEMGAVLTEDEINADNLFNKVKFYYENQEYLVKCSQKAYNFFREKHQINIIDEMLRRV